MVLNHEKIGEFIQSRRKLARLTQAELSERLNVTEQAVSNWERGESLPNTALLPDLAMILDTSVDELLGATELAQMVLGRMEEKNKGVQPC